MLGWFLENWHEEASVAAKDASGNFRECRLNDVGKCLWKEDKHKVKVIWQKAPHGGPIPRLGVTPGGRKLYHWIPGVGIPISVP